MDLCPELSEFFMDGKLVGKIKKTTIFYIKAFIPSYMFLIYVVFPITIKHCIICFQVLRKEEEKNQLYCIV